jgi:hypothetical protein
MCGRLGCCSAGMSSDGARTRSDKSFSWNRPNIALGQSEYLRTEMARRTIAGINGGELRPGSSKADGRTHNGRRPGTPNTITRMIKDTALAALEKVGKPRRAYDKEGKFIEVVLMFSQEQGVSIKAAPKAHRTKSRA